MQELSKFISDCGFLSPGSIVADGKMHRFSVDRDDKKESGYYIFFQNYGNRTGQQFFAGIVGSWKSGESFSYTSSIPYSKEDRAIAAKKVAEAQRKAEAEKRARQEATSSECEKKWDSIQEGLSDYHRAKKMAEPYGARIESTLHGVSAYIPMRDVDGKLWSLQKIQADGGKFFYPGGKVHGCFHVIGEIGETVYIAEGFATAAAIYAATGRGVVAAFNSGNLAAVAGELKRRHTDKAFVICGDEDRGTEGNPGRTKAEEAAKAVMGTAVFPRFQSTSEKLTDFDDLLRAEGIDVVREQLLGVRAEKAAVIPLGFNGEEYYFTSTHNQQVVVMTSFSDTQFLNLMMKEYWEAAYPNTKNGIDWLAAKSDMMAQARRRGIFDQKRVRGAGVWMDDDRIVVNMGDHLLVNGEKKDLGDLKSRHFYTLGTKLPSINPKPLTFDECSLITKTAHLFKWKNPDFGYLLAGAMVTTRVCGALPIRPHVWVTGERGSGKSTLFNDFIYPLIGEPLLYLAGNSTEAGIRQEVRANAVPVLFDEFENNGRKSAETIQSVIDLMRVAWSETNASILKGSAGGTAQSFQARFAGIVTSVRQVSLSDADRSRFATIELGPHGNDLEHYKELKSLLVEISTSDYGSRLFARSIQMLPVLLKNFKALKAAMNRKSPGQRFADQYGMLLAGYSILITDEALTPAEADEIASWVSLEEEKRVYSVTDQESCLNQLLTKKVQLQEMDGSTGRTERNDYSFGEAILKASANALAGEALACYGIRVEPEWFAVRVSHTELEGLVYRDTRWSNSWGPALMRLEGARRKSVRIAGTAGECIVIPMTSLTE